jgi:hypothetical protein
MHDVAVISRVDQRGTYHNLRQERWGSECVIVIWLISILFEEDYLKIMYQDRVKQQGYIIEHECGLQLLETDV